MNKRLSLSILILIISTLLVYGQEITFQKNVNFRANVLTQSLTKEGDSLLLETKNKEIRQVAIFNEDFSESIDVYSNKTKIDLKTLPIGNFIIQAELDKKLIIMYLKKNEDLKISSLNQMAKDITPKHEANKIEKKKKNLYYWVVHESNTGFSSYKSMRLESKDEISKLIEKNKLERKSEVGKNNKLLVYELYNKSKFMSKQIRNREYYTSRKSEFFNVVPIYTSAHKMDNEPES